MKNAFFCFEPKVKNKHLKNFFWAKSCIVGLLALVIIVIIFMIISQDYARATRCLSEYRECLFYLKSEDFVATFTSGKREKDFSYDGTKTRLVPYGVLVVEYFSPIDDLGDRHFVILIDSMQYTDELEYNPIDGTFVCDLGVEVCDDSDLYLRLWGGGVSDQAYMQCLSNRFIGYKKALKVAIEHFKSELSDYKSGLKFSGEFFIKFVGDKSLDNLSYYIQFIGQDKRSFICLVGAYTGEIGYTKSL